MQAAQLSYLGSKNDGPTHCYVNVQINNGSFVTADATATFQQQFQAPIISNPTDYHMSVVRFSVPSGDIPSYIVPALIGQADPAVTTFTVGLASSDGTRASAAVRWVPENTVANTPLPPTTSQDVTSGWYFGNSYQGLADCINTAFAACVTTLAGLGKTVLAPRLEYDLTTYTFSLYADAATFEAGVATPCKIYFNKALASILQNMRTLVLQDTTFAFQVVMKYNPMKTNVTAATDPYPTYLCHMQEYPNLCPLTALNAIQLVTSVPIASEYFSNTSSYGTSLRGTGTGNRTLKILTDFHVNTSVGFEAKQGPIEYSPSSEYRLADITQNMPLTSLDLQVFWSDHYGNSYPLTLPPNAGFSCKIMFRRKDYLVA